MCYMYQKNMYQTDGDQYKAFAVYDDEQLCKMARSGDHVAEVALLSRYYAVLHSCVRTFLLVSSGVEELLQEDDFIQEGMLGLLSAVYKYDGTKNATFRTFAEVCIRNRLASARTTAFRKKHEPLNQSLSLDAPSANPVVSDSTVNLDDNPETKLLAREQTDDLLRAIREELSDFERTVFSHYYVEGWTVHEIADAVGKPLKSVGNAVQRIRQKAARKLSYGDISHS